MVPNWISTHVPPGSIPGSSSKRTCPAKVCRAHSPNWISTTMIVSTPPTNANGACHDGAHEIPVEYSQPDRPSDPAAKDVTPKIVTYTLGDLMERFPQMRDPVIHGLLRVGETMNIIAAPK